MSRSQLTRISSIREPKIDSGPTRPDVIGESPLSLCRRVVLGTLKILLAFNIDDPFCIAASLTFDGEYVKSFILLIFSVFFFTQIFFIVHLKNIKKFYKT